MGREGGKKKGKKEKKRRKVMSIQVKNTVFHIPGKVYFYSWPLLITAPL